ncbi:hypothetical protein IQ264_16530 [Phormidium sp. LEGE 05292]|uniref:hypothetical protein n=1 Tax=[Phormidium] sp. LEGE 05292 TaxID=767427 RepID=UPI00187EC5DB|nr:hypothetical protein [Phormidium sp. LEGE 05292]MBE9227036.1 hypothetical protein [Phormidium sp. LEGE 05292]
MKYNLVIYISLLACVVSACSSSPQGNLLRDDELSTAPAPQGTVLRDDDNKNQFQEGVNQAKNATNMAKSAKTEAELKVVVNQWNKAIELMKSVPKTDPNYQLSQQKIVEYQKSLGEVKKKLQK